MPMLLATAVLTTLTVLSHNVTVAVFVLAFIAACCAYVIGRAPSHLVARSAVAAAITRLYRRQSWLTAAVLNHRNYALHQLVSDLGG